jgi:signal recognition particle subunit SRP54
VNKLIKQFDETRKMMKMMTAMKMGSKKLPSMKKITPKGE